MNLKLFIQNLYSRALGIIGSPKEEWIKIKEENASIGHLIVNFALPLLLITGLSSTVGTYIHRDGKSLSAAWLIIAGLRPVLSISVSLLFSILSVNAHLRSFGGTPDPVITTKLVLFSFLPVILVTIILGMAPDIYFAGLFSLYSFYILFFGAQVLPEIESERQLNFSMLSSTIILVTYIIVNYILTAIFGAIQ
ncbi:MAG: Yip1 family protein [Mariniphaga sp.]